jgi:ABC-2 type transport system permease protein
VISNGVFLFFAFASSAFYPSQGVPEPLKTAFYINPLTYIVDISRAGIFDQVTQFTNVQVLIIGIVAICAFLVATISMVRMRI